MEGGILKLLFYPLAPNFFSFSTPYEICLFETHYNKILRIFFFKNQLYIMLTIKLVPI